MHLTDMDIANKRIPVETKWVESTLNTGLENILELEKQYDALITQRDQAMRVRDKDALKTALESYRGMSGHNVSMENFQGTMTQKNHLASVITQQLQQVDLKLWASLENYVQDIKEDFGDKLKAYEKIRTKLETTDADIESPNKKTVTVNHTKIYEMFHVKDVFKGEEAAATIRKEDTNIARLVTMVGTAVSRIKKDISDLGKDGKLERKAQDLPKVDRLFLMFNRRAEVVDGQFEFEAKKTRGPKKYFTWKQNAIIILGTLIFRDLGASIATNFQTPKGNTAKVDVSLAEVHKFIRYVEGFQDNIDDLSAHIDDLVKLFSKVDEQNHSALNRRAAPIMELAEFIVKHVTDITRGTDTLFSRLVRKN